MTNHVAQLQPSNLKNIDGAVLDFVKNINIHAMSNKGFKKVPVVWSGAERVYQIKNDLELRDSKGILILPQISLRRTSTSKMDSSEGRGSYYSMIPEYGDVKGSTVEWVRKINQKKTSEFANARSLRKTGKLNFKTTKKSPNPVVYNIVSIPMPVYLKMGYEIILRSDYQSQMNDMVAPMLDYAGNQNYFIVERDGWRYECFFEEDIGIDNNIVNFDEEERVFRSTFNLSVLGYIIGADKNDDQPVMAVRENAVTISFSESTFSGSIPE